MTWRAKDLTGTISTVFDVGILSVVDNGDGSLSLTSGANPAVVNAGPVNQVVTAVLSNTPCWTSFTLSYAQLAAASVSTNQVTLFSLPANGVVSGCRIHHTVSFSGGSLSGYTCSCGTASTPTLFGPAFNVFQAVAPTAFGFTAIGTSLNTSASTAIVVQAVSTGDTLDHAVAGSVQIDLLLSVMA
jgi:hypothetical protein